MRIYFNTTETSVLLFYANSWLPAPLLAGSRPNWLIFIFLVFSTFATNSGTRAWEKLHEDKFLSHAVSFLYSHEAVDGGQVVPGAEQEKGETDEDKQAAEVHEEILHDEPPEADPAEIHWDVLTLEEQRHGGG